MKASEMNRGLAVKYEGEIYIIVDFTHVMKGNKRSYMQTKLKHISQGGIRDVRFRMDDTIEDVFLDKKQMQFLYATNTEACFMDVDTYDQISISPDLLGDKLLYLKGEEMCELHFYEGQLINMILPHTVELKVVDTPPQIKGATATNQLKDATLETGLKIRVPPFVQNNEVVRVDTRSGEYLERIH